MSKLSKKSVITATVLSLALLAIIFPAHAEAKPEKGKVFGDWGIECETAPDKTEQCFASQTQTMKDQKGRLLKLSIGYIGPKNVPTMVAMLPLGIDIPAGAAYKVENSKDQVKLLIKSCTVEGCAAVTQLTPAQLKEINTGKSMVIGIMPPGGTKTMTIPVPLNGFTQAFATLK